MTVLCQYLDTGRFEFPGLNDYILVGVFNIPFDATGNIIIDRYFTFSLGNREKYKHLAIAVNALDSLGRWLFRVITILFILSYYNIRRLIRITIILIISERDKSQSQEKESKNKFFHILTIFLFLQIYVCFYLRPNKILAFLILQAKNNILTISALDVVKN